VLSEHLAAEPHTRLRYFCSPHHQDSALYPFIVQLDRAALPSPPSSLSLPRILRLGTGKGGVPRRCAQTVDIIRDKLDARGIALLRQPEFMS
jgi:hypothetical protein